MTPTELMGAVAMRVGDPGMETFPRKAVMYRVNTAQNKVAAELRPKELITSSSNTWAATTDSYDIVSDWSVTDFVKEVKVTWDGYHLKQGTLDDLDEHSSGSSSPGFYVIHGTNIQLGPLPPSAEKTVVLYYIKQPTQITTSVMPTSFDIPDEYLFAVELFAAYALTGNPDWYRMYKVEIEDLRWHNIASEDPIVLEPPIN